MDSQSLYKNAPYSSAFDHLSDSIFIFEAQKLIRFVELKSKCSKGNMRKAFNQVIASFLKLYIHLGIFASFDLSDYRFEAWIVSLPIDEEEKTKCVKGKERNKDYQFMYQLCISSTEMPIVTSDMTSVEKLTSIKNDIKHNLQIKFKHLPVQNGDRIRLDAHWA